MKTLLSLFPRASQSTIDVNPDLSATSTLKTNKNALQGNVRRKRGIMNKTEKEFSLILEAMKQKGEIRRWEFEGITLRFAGVKYTPDFLVIDPSRWGDNNGEVYSFRMIEVKGPYIKGKFERAIERFRHARTYYPEFTFELHQKTKEGWKQLI